MIQLLEDTALTQNRFNLIFIHKLVLLQNFDGIKASSVYFTSKDYLAETSSSNHFNLFEVFDCNLTFLSQIEVRTWRAI